IPGQLERVGHHPTYGLRHRHLWRGRRLWLRLFSAAWQEKDESNDYGSPPRGHQFGSRGALAGSRVAGRLYVDGASNRPQFVRSRISALISGGTRSAPSRICQPPPSARYTETRLVAMLPSVLASASCWVSSACWAVSTVVKSCTPSRYWRMA